MIKITNIQTYGWDAAIRGMRNPMNSWDKSDSHEAVAGSDCKLMLDCKDCDYNLTNCFVVGPNDLSLMLKLAKSGTDHAKYRRMITVTMDILAPLYWWKEFDTYKVGTVANSCSTMHKITEKEFTIDDFSHEHLCDDYGEALSFNIIDGPECVSTPEDILSIVASALNTYRNAYLDTKNKYFWWQLIQLLPSSYNQLRTVQLNYEVLANIYRSRREHKLDEWREFCAEIEKLPYSEIITLKEE